MTRDESGRYTVGWPWKQQSREHLALNRDICERRLQRLLARMSEDEYQEYDGQIKQLLYNGYIEEVPEHEVPQSYLPHRGVVKMSSTTTKLRIV